MIVGEVESASSNNNHLDSDANLTFDTHSNRSGLDKEPLGQSDWLPAKVPEALGALTVFILAISVTVGVILRYAGFGVLGLVELAALSMLLIVVLGAAGLSYRDEHVRLELIDAKIGEKNISRLELFVDAFQILVTAVVVFALFEVFRSDLETGTTLSGELDIARKWVSGTAMICFSLVGIVLVRKAVIDIRTVRDRTDNG